MAKLKDGTRVYGTLTVDSALTANADVTINGNLVINGTTTTTNSHNGRKYPMNFGY